MLEELQEQLEAIANPPSHLKQDAYFRCYVCPIYFMLLFPQEEREEAKKAFKQITAEAVKRNIHFGRLGAAAIRGEYELPPFIQKNLANWEKAMLYLAYGSSDVDTSLPRNLIQAAKANVNLMMIDEMQQVLQQEFK
jgi:hypothetical protein